MTASISLEDILRDVERDKDLRDNIRDLRRATASLNLNEHEYREKIIKGLNYLVEKHTRNLFKENHNEISACSVLLNYDSLLFTSNFKSLDRIRQPESLPVRLNHKKDEELAKYISLVVDHIFDKVAMLFQMHLFVQDKIFYHDLLKRYIRTPLFLITSDNTKKEECRYFNLGSREWTRKTFNNILNKFDEFVNKERKRLNYTGIKISDLAAYMYYLTYLTGIESDPEFKKIRKKEFDEAYDIDPSILNRINSQRSKLEIEGINLCVIAISDELSEQPLGTAMIFYNGNLSYKLALKMHELFFEYMNALRKVEFERISSRHTLQFLLHEVRHQKEELMRLTDVESIKGSISSFISLIEASAYEAGFDIQVNVNQKLIKQKLQLFKKTQPGQFDIQIDSLEREEYDWREAFIIIEAIRNGINNLSNLTKLNIKIKLNDKNGKLEFECISQPHDVVDPKILIEKLNSDHPDVLIEQRGIRWIKKYAYELGYDYNWKIEPTGDQHRIIFKLKPKEN